MALCKCNKSLLSVRCGQPAMCVLHMILQHRHSLLAHSYVIMLILEEQQQTSALLGLH